MSPVPKNSVSSCFCILSVNWWRLLLKSCFFWCYWHSLGCLILSLKKERNTALRNLGYVSGAGCFCVSPNRVWKEYVLPLPTFNFLMDYKHRTVLLAKQSASRLVCLDVKKDIYFTFKSCTCAILPLPCKKSLGTRLDSVVTNVWLNRH